MQAHSPTLFGGELLLLLFLLLSIIAFSGLGAAFGYKWPGARWKWGLWLAALPAVPFAIMSAAYTRRILAPAFIIVIALLSAIFSCVAAGLTARYALRMSQPRAPSSAFSHAPSSPKGRFTTWFIIIPVVLLLVASGITLAILSASSSRQRGCPTITATCRPFTGFGRDSELDGSWNMTPALLQTAPSVAEFQVSVSHDNLRSSAGSLTTAIQAFSALQLPRPHEDIPFGVSSIRWTVSAGRIVSGQGTSLMYVDTTGLAGQTIRATADARMEDERCSERISCSVLVPGR